MEEKLIVSYIWSWQVQDKCCFASDDFLALALGTNSFTVREIILSLEKRNKITITRASSSTARMLSMKQYDGVDPCVAQLDVFNI
jgi:hypothetical protein